MRKPEPTLIDTLYRMTFRNENVLRLRSNAALRQVLTDARRFVLDDEMSTFLGELCTAAFVTGKKSAAVQHRMVDQLRISARSPHRTVWIEYNIRNSLQRSNELLQQKFDPNEVPHREGWLIQQHDELSTAFRLHLFTANPPQEADRQGFDHWGFPIVYSWTVDDSPSPWRSVLDNNDGYWATGVKGYDAHGCVTLTTSEMIDDPREHKNRIAIVDLVHEWTGVLRRVFALLATINDIPVLRTEIKQSRGFVAKGRYRRFLDHTTITLQVPQKLSLRKLARQMIAIARRRAHQVRGHFRLDWRNPPSDHCPALLAEGGHAWGTDNVCTACRGHRLWIVEHVRGDASLGFVTHNYLVEHPNEA
jgi:hypothetical protein